MRKAVTVSVIVYLAIQAFLILVLVSHGKGGNLTVGNFVRPFAILFCFAFYLGEGGKWSFFLAIWSGAGVVRFILYLPPPGLGYLEGGAELLVVIFASMAWRTDPHRSYYLPSLLNRLRARFLPAPQLIVIPLGTKLDDLFRQFKLIAESDEETFLKGCTHYEISLRDQAITVAVDDGAVVGVIYHTESYGNTEAERVRKLSFYLKAHGQESSLKFLVNNGSGFLYRSSDEETRASYSYVADVFSVSRFGYDMT